jgi:hypothetical protein
VVTSRDKYAQLGRIGGAGDEEPRIPENNDFLRGAAAATKLQNRNTNKKDPRLVNATAMTVAIAAGAEVSRYGLGAGAGAGAGSGAIVPSPAGGVVAGCSVAGFSSAGGVVVVALSADSGAAFSVVALSASDFSFPLSQAAQPRAPITASATKTFFIIILRLKTSIDDAQKREVHRGAINDGNQDDQGALQHDGPQCSH